ncbi:Unknown protein [Striga hermonthica]|uniref:leucine--tRNA ligase n=1 Tax=Striga hermonthica TaxID=68872 RepID=A0A9N7R9W1_STRHE|nr:Unknown protein [Striga hermonthica]
MAEESGRSFARRDKLLEMESKVQKLWSEGDVFHGEPPKEDAKPKQGEKFYGNFPFPYMNGYLHLGHAFSLSKLEFAAAYHRLRGANVLLPFAFHCTGMPIKASADKLKREIQRFGNPPVFPAEEIGEHEGKPTEGEADGNPGGGKFKGKKSKVVAKSGGIKYQWEIMQSYGLSDEEIAKFTNPYHWLTFFPPLAVEDLKAFGLGCDWRRTFITTDMNPYFDSFVRWQVRKLKDMGKIVKDLRYTIYSPLDGQPCADHDRASGEGVIPQEYTLIKMEVISPFPPKMSSALEGKKVYLAAATLRPETMYGQTNCWVLPDGKYGAFEINDTEVFILTRRAALNLAYQKLSRVPEKPTCLVELTGQDLIGLPLKAPLACNDVIYTLPMLSVLTDKGTGIVTSVPSDSPDDYMALHDLKAKPAFRAKYGVKDEWILPFEIIPIIHHPDFGDKSAERVCIEKKIKSQNEREKLDEAKKIIYKGGFYEGTMLVGEFTGMKVQEAKGLIRSKLLELEQAVVYSEPEKKVMSRSGDECVVALTDQWYITYGEQEWKKAAVECLAGMNLYSDETRHGFEHTLSWLNQWACSRSFGLGTRIPWDEEFLVESLSDSTLYMAYYTVAHMLQRGDMYGADRSSVKPEQLTDEVWDFLFVDGPYPKSSDLPATLLNKMKQEFEYWYPFDLRVSGKDLIQNHLTFCIYNHAAIMPKHHWPKGFRCNGHIMLNSEKMSKSTGNFRTLRQAIEEFSADATRFSLADAGDGMDDANFVFETANAAILRLTKEISWMEEVIAAESSLRNTPPTTYADRVFANEMNIAVKSTEKNFSDYMFREALKSGFYDLQAARDEYRLSCGAGGMNRDLLWRFMDIQTRLIAPICPHYAEHVWKELLKKGGYVVKAGWPEADSPDLTLKKANKYLQDTIVSMRKLLQKQATGSKKGGKTGPTNAAQSVKPTTGLIFVNEQYDGWKKECLNILKRKFDSATCTFAPDQEILSELAKSDVGQSGNFKQIQKLCMPFLRFKKDEVKAVGVQALDLKLPFGEIEVLVENVELIKRQLGLEHLEVVSNADGKRDEMGIIYEDAVLIKEAVSEGEHTVITVNCPDKTGLGCDLCRVILLFGLSIVRGDFSTDGKWCYLVFWVIGKLQTKWSLLRMRLLDVCPKCTPSASGIFYFIPEFQPTRPPEIFLLKFWCSYDRKGLLHDVTEVLYELELTIKRVKVYTAPDGRVMDLFFITDTRELLQTSSRRDETMRRLKFVLGDAMMTCEIEPASHEVASFLHSFSSSSDVGNNFLHVPVDSVAVEFDNSLSPSHTLVRIICRDHKGLIYDIMRTLKDYNIQISYGRFFANAKGNCEMDLFITEVEGEKIVDDCRKSALCSRLKTELVHPLRVDVVSRGPDSELLVANPVELSGRGRPLVFYDITLALKILSINIFSVEIGRTKIEDREWEVYRILLDEWDYYSTKREEIKERVRSKLMGWDV